MVRNRCPSYSWLTGKNRCTNVSMARAAPGTPAQPVVPVGVVTPALVRIAEHFIGLGGLLELLLTLGVVLVDVGMVLPRQLAVGFLDLLEVCVALDSQHVVVVTFHLAAAHS